MEKPSDENYTGVSVARYLYQNIHIVGFQKQNRIINTVLRELLDNSQDECARRGILPRISVRITNEAPKVYGVVVTDNGPGVPLARVPQIAGQVLYGDKFVDKVSLRGQQGIGLKGVVLYSMKSTGKPIRIVSKTAHESKATVTLLSINLDDNTPRIHQQYAVDPESYFPQGHGFRVQVSVKATYTTKGLASTPELLRRYVYLNPCLHLEFQDPEESWIYERKSQRLVSPGTPVNRIPHHQQVGDLVEMLRGKTAEGQPLLKVLMSNLYGDQSRYLECLARCHQSPFILAAELTDNQIEMLHSTLVQVFSTMQPPQGTLPVLNEAIRVSVTENYQKHYDTAVMYQSPTVFSGTGLLQVEVCAFYGGDLMQDQKISVQRVANGSPLTYLASSCCINSTVNSFPWRRYGLQQVEGELPRGPLLLVVHVLGTKVPYTGPGKDAISNNSEVERLIVEGLTVVGKAIRRYRHREQLKKSREEKLAVITRTMPQLVRTLYSYKKERIATPETLSRLYATIMDGLLVITNHKQGIIEIINGSGLQYTLSVGYPGLPPSNYQAYTVRGSDRIRIPVQEGYFLEGLNPQEYVEISSVRWQALVQIGPDATPL